MLSKNKNTRDPAQYRPMTCLLTIYKLLIAYLQNKIYAHVEANNTLAEQRNKWSWRNKWSVGKNTWVAKNNSSSIQ